MKALLFAMLAGTFGCTFVQSIPPAEAGTYKEKVVYSFAGGTDGWRPNQDLLAKDALLYGTTIYGGVYNAGIAFSIDPVTGAETVLHSFGSGTDGASPEGRLVNVKGTLYGTTYQGGDAGCEYGCGTVFALDPATGTETPLYAFCTQQKCTDGAGPRAGLKYLDGTLYGTTSGGGAAAGGTVFAIDPATGKEKAVYSFCSQQNCTDGRYPQSNLITANGGILYGTTSDGGAHGKGTVFSVDPVAKAEKVLHSFGARGDGGQPVAGLLDVKGVLYGTTQKGGPGTCRCGVVFSIDPTDAEKILYAFAGTDGSQPTADLIAMNGTLYSTTFYGGAYGLGTVFSLDPGTGVETVLHSFCESSCTDGFHPLAGLTAINGWLYGDTTRGGVNCSGCGTLFVLYPKKR